MAGDNLTASLGLDASQAISALAAADAAAAKFDSTLSNLASTMSRVGTASSAIESFGTRTSTSLNQAGSAAQSFTMNWQNVERIVESRLISQAIYGVKDSIESSISSAIKLGKELQQISNMTGTDSQILGQQVRFLADATAISLEEAAKSMSAAYRANIGGMQESHALVDEASHLAKATGTEMPGAVTAVGSILKGFGLGVGEARKVTDELYTVTIKSRATVDELSGAFSRAAPLASRLGVSFEETAASVITLVNGGMSVSQALGTVERTMRSLATPSAALTADMQSMGANSATSLIAAKGWQGTLEALAGTTSGTAEELMKLVKGARGVSAEFTIGTSRAEDYKKALDDIQNTKTGAAAEAAAAVMDSAAGRVEAAGIRIKNTMIGMGDKMLNVLSPVSGALPWDKFAEGLTGAAIGAIPLFAGKFLGQSRFQTAFTEAQENAGEWAARLDKQKMIAGAPNRIESEFNLRRTAADKAASEALRAEGENSAAYAAAAAKREEVYARTEATQQRALDRVTYLEKETAAATRTTKAYEIFGGVLKGVGVSVMGLAAGYIIGSGFNDQMAKIRTTIDEAEAHWLEQKRAVDQRLIDSDAEVVSKKIQSSLNANSELSKTYESQLTAAREEGQAEIHVAEEKLRQMLDAHKGYVVAIVAAEKEAHNEIQDDEKRIAKLKDDADKEEFDQRLEQTGDMEGQLLMLQRRRNDLSDEARAKMEEGARTGNKDEIARGRALFSEAEANAKKVEAIAKSQALAGVKTPGEKANALSFDTEYTLAHKGVQGVSDAQIEAEQAVIAIHKQHIAQLQAEKEYQEEVNKVIERQTKIATDNAKILDREGNLLPQTQRDQMAQRRQAAERELGNLGFNADDSARAGQLGLSKVLEEQIEKQPKPVRLQFDVENSLKMIPAKIDAVFANYKVHLNVDVAGLETALGRPIKSAQDLTQGYKALGAELKGIESKAYAIKGMNDQINALRAGIVTTKEVGESGWGGAFRSLLNATDISGTASNIETIKHHFIELSNSSNLTINDLTKIRDEVKGLGADSFASSAGTRLWVADFAQMLQKLIEIRETQQKINAEKANVPTLNMRNEYFNDVLNRSPGGSVSSEHAVNGIVDLGAAAQTTAQKLALLDTLVDQENTRRTQATAPVQLNTPQPSAIINGEVGRHFGGFLAEGGYPRGTDTVHAMLSKGEFVVNEHSARKFGAQLHAMNSGVKPNHYAHGGSVTNVGDINVQVSGGHSPYGTGREIATAIRRELRRGSSSLSQ